MLTLKNISLSLLSLCCLVPLSSNAQTTSATTKRSTTSTTDTSTLVTPKQAPASRTGTRFVVSRSTGGSVPRNLYYIDNNGISRLLSFPSQLPSTRIAYPRGGRYDFWDKDPRPQTAAKSSTISTGSTPAVEEAPLPPPLFSVPVPSGISGQAICILQPQIAKKDSGAKNTVYACFLSEDSVPKKGQSILNLSPYNLILMTSATGDYKQRKTIQLAACRDPRKIETSNFYVFPGKSGETVYFILSVKLPNISELTRVRASNFILSPMYSQVTMVFRNLTKAGVSTETLRID